MEPSKFPPPPRRAHSKQYEHSAKLLQKLATEGDLHGKALFTPFLFPLSLLLYGGLAVIVYTRKGVGCNYTPCFPGLGGSGKQPASARSAPRMRLRRASSTFELVCSEWQPKPRTQKKQPHSSPDRFCFGGLVGHLAFTCSPKLFEHSPPGGKTATNVGAFLVVSPYSKLCVKKIGVQDH